MVEEIDYSEYIPEDLLEEIMEYEKENKRRNKKIYPSSRDIVETVKEAAIMARGVHPDEFPDIVLRLLKEKGFDTRYVTVKRIWRVYENLVRKGVIPDTLHVVSW
ncbi:hypothetical protein Smar_0552 [Staphylothermus marinus F1]|uniref:Uncharacterized protein n=1 Tax=Staphylothermus marinus (strain ATCC 43588 / DSM 3639 / JCM 9404 / F1) TaxID=399550 RepID=A3DLZ9_STAMF|nr:hypothetical protein [Staphylothermus marinus]ABN69659.1 hypothetical protein Smar_0552 [Staphylothermus marinus F1]